MTFYIQTKSTAIRLNIDTQTLTAQFCSPETENNINRQGEKYINYLYLIRP